MVALAHSFADWAFLSWDHPDLLAPLQTLGATDTRHLAQISNDTDTKARLLRCRTGDI